jgi:hypothetical protein
MRIENLCEKKNGNLARVSAGVVWEDRNRPSQEIYIDTTEEFSEGLTCNPHAFLLGCIMVAFYCGEQRIAIDAEVCPELLEGLETAMSLFRYWYQIDYPVVKIEAKVHSHFSVSPTPDRAGSFFSGGIDALATLRSNRLRYALNHPSSIKDCLVIHGISDTTVSSFEEALKSFSPIQKDAEINIIPVYTNIYDHIRDLENSNYTLWRNYLMGSVIAAVGHAFQKRLTTVSIASSKDIPNLETWGTNPLLDPYYGSYNLRIRHQGITLSRLDKTKLVSEWDIALQNLRVCDELNLPAGYQNCGHCEKCTRTILMLVALGALEKTNAFPMKDLTEEQLLANSRFNSESIEAEYLSIIPALKERGRHDLIRGIQQVSRRFREKDIQGWIKRFDRTFLNQSMYQYYMQHLKQ